MRMQRLSRRAVFLTISADTRDYDVFASAGSPTDAVAVFLTINSGVYVGSTSASTPGLQTAGSWAPNSALTIINNGYIVGRGGNGGVGGSISSVNGGAGGNGGNAINLGINVTIDNGGGSIFGGGGGGGGGGGYFDGLAQAAGGGGGGGRGYDGGSGGEKGSGNAANGTAGSKTSAGAGGQGGFNATYQVSGGDGKGGGDWGANGSQGQAAGDFGEVPGGAGGTAGKAINLNGYSVTWLAGNNLTQVKGAAT